MKTLVRASLLAATLAATAATVSYAAPPSKVHPRPYGRGSATLHETRVAPYRFINEIVKVSFDFDRGLVTGETTNVISPKSDGLATVPFDSVGLNYSSVTVDGAAAKYRVDDGTLYVDLARAAKAGDKITIVAGYTTTPARGIYFIRPDKAYPDMQPEIWSQGEAEDNRRWFPTWDEPNEKSPSELVVSVRHGWTVIANGTLRSQHDNADGTTTFDWVESHPHSTYLTAFSAGPYVKHHTITTRPDGSEIPVDYFTSEADSKWADLCFGRTKDIVAFFQQTIGVTYPWEKYDQTTVERFTAGGMENASATTQTEFAIHPPAYDLEQPCDGLVSHELAHQWWGDDVTTPDWPSIWINEGFATYFQELWSQHHFGNDEFDYERYGAQQSYFNETKRYWRPIVEYTYAQPMDSFDASGYPRPGEVLHMLRWMYGDKRFFAALHDYLVEYQYRNADTHQFFAAMEKSLGVDLGWFEEEWFHRASYPHFYVKQSYDRRTHVLSLDITQKNHDGKPFRMPIDVAVYAAGQGRQGNFVADQNHQVLNIGNVASEPQMVLFDPGNNVLRELDYVKSVPELGYQALHAPFVTDRLWAIDQLGKTGKSGRPLATQFLRDAIGDDPFYGVRIDAVQTAAGLDDARAVRAALDDKDPRVVIAAAAAVDGMDHPGDAQVVAALTTLARSDDALVAGAALHGLGATRARTAYGILVAGLDRHAFREPIARGALLGLAAFGDAKAIPLIRARTAYGIDESERPDAITALGRLGAQRPARVVQALLDIAKSDPYFRARVSAVRALGKLGASSAIPDLEKIEATDSEPSVANAAWDAIADLHDRERIKLLKKP